jgi:nanoRNase/pAp phosphatase (c-di-AMP/oligoRNAs hydrolase)
VIKPNLTYIILRVVDTGNFLGFSTRKQVTRANANMHKTNRHMGKALQNLIEKGKEIL